MFEIFKEFRFEAAHALDDSSFSHGRYSRLHGHSYRAQIFLRGERTNAGWVLDLGELKALMIAAHDDLDHHFLNEIPDLGPPTLENLSCYIWNRLKPRIDGLHKIAVYRDSCGEGCTYYGPQSASTAVEAEEVAHA
jgi:6-pyruvoyltetrahydropterin/6-carboxytetrahydropterin synthase